MLKCSTSKIKEGMSVFLIVAVLEERGIMPESTFPQTPQDTITLNLLYDSYLDKFGVCSKEMASKPFQTLMPLIETVYCISVWS